MNKKRIIMMGITTSLGLILAGCGHTPKTSAPKQGTPPLQVSKDDRVIDLGMQGAQHYSAFDANNQVKAKVKTAPNAQISLKEPVRDNKYDYHVHPQGNGKYQVVFDNKGMRNEDKFPLSNDIVVKSPSYTKPAQAGISLHTTTDNIKQSIVQDVNQELGQDDIKNEDLNGKVNVSVTGKSTIDSAIKINIESNVTPMPPTDTVIAALKGIRNVDMSTFQSVTINVGTKDDPYWYKFTPFSIKTMPLDHLDTNDLDYVSIDNNVNN